MTCGIYALVFDNGKAYIGSSKHIEKRFRQHETRLKYNWHHSTALQRAWNKYQICKNVIIERCSEENLIEREQFWFDNYPTIFKGLYNSSKIAGRVEMTETTRAKMSKSNRGQIRSEETRKRISEAKKGKPMGARVYSPETIEKFRQGAAKARAAKLNNPVALAKDLQSIKIAQAAKLANPAAMAVAHENMRKGRLVLAAKREAAKVAAHVAMVEWIFAG